MNFKLISLAILAGLILIFVMQNIAVVEIQFLFWSTQMPRSLMVLLVLLVGVICGWILHSFLHNKKLNRSH